MGTPPSPSSLPPPSPLLSSAPAGPSALILRPGAAWSDAWDRCVQAAPEAFTADGRIRSLVNGAWRDGDEGGEVPPTTSPLDATPIARPAATPPSVAREAVTAAGDRHRAWRHVPPPERGARTAAALDALAEHRTLLALLQVWEYGMPWRHAQSDVDRAVDGARRAVGTVGQIRGGLAAPAAYIAKPHGTAGELLHAMLLRTLAGDAVVAGTAGGSAASVSLACALCVREGLPFTLVGGRGACDAVAEAANGGRCFLEEPLPPDGAASPAGAPGGGEPAGRGPDCWGVWACSDWEAFGRSVRSAPLRAGRPAVCSRFVVQRSLLDDFLEAYLPVLRALSYGHPLAVASPEDPFPALDFGPLPDAATARRVHERIRRAVGEGAVLLHQGLQEEGAFLSGQDTSAYVAPAALLSPPPRFPPHPARPPAPVGTVVLVDTEAELAEAMNASAADASDGSASMPVARLVTGDAGVRERLAPRIRSAAAAHPGGRGRRGAARNRGRPPETAA